MFTRKTVYLSAIAVLIGLMAAEDAQAQLLRGRFRNRGGRFFGRRNDDSGQRVIREVTEEPDRPEAVQEPPPARPTRPETTREPQPTRPTEHVIIPSSKPEALPTQPVPSKPAAPVVTQPKPTEPATSPRETVFIMKPLAEWDHSTKLNLSPSAKELLGGQNRILYIKDSNGQFIAIGTVDGAGRIQPQEGGPAKLEPKEPSAIESFGEPLKKKPSGDK